MPAKGIKNIQVVCPGFSADCLETLEEIAIENRDIFMEAGGESYDYISCLNADNEHIAMIAELIAQHIQGWTKGQDPNMTQKTLERALELGANC